MTRMLYDREARMTRMLSFRITGRTLALALFALLLLSRASVTTTVVYVPLDTKAVQVTYVCVMAVLAVFGMVRRGVRLGRPRMSTVLAAILLLYIVLFGAVFVNPPLARYTSEILLRQTLFLLVVFVTVAVARTYRILDEMLLCAYAVFTLILVVQFASHIQELSLLNVSTVLSVDDRTRAAYGFSHYNALGAFCVCQLAMAAMLRRRGVMRGFPVPVRALGWAGAALSVVMLLGSASRSALTGAVVYLLCYGFMALKGSSAGRRVRFFTESAIVVALLLFVAYGLTGLSARSLLDRSNRQTLFEVAIPTFLHGGRTMTGLGLASSELYGTNATPYRTYWLDNSYVYTLVTTGYLGLLLYLVMIALLVAGLLRLRDGATKRQLIALAVMTLYTALFENTLFWAGVMQNYVYLTLFLSALGGYFDGPPDGIEARELSGGVESSDLTDRNDRIIETKETMTI